MIFEENKTFLCDLGKVIFCDLLFFSHNIILHNVKNIVCLYNLHIFDVN